MLVRLIYASRIAEGQGDEVIDAILQQSRAKNPQLGITGVLCYDGRMFMQALEGGRNVVSNLYNRIANDPRHRDVIILSYEEIGERCFSGWTMGLVSVRSVTPCLLLRYSERAELDPYNVSGQVSLALLKELIATAQVIGRSV
jgi:hypothetical protein